MSVLSPTTPLRADRRGFAVLLIALLMGVAGCDRPAPETTVIEPKAAATTGMTSQDSGAADATAAGDLLARAAAMSDAVLSTPDRDRDASRMIRIAILESLLLAEQDVAEPPFALTGEVLAQAEYLDAHWAALGFPGPPGWAAQYRDYQTQTRESRQQNGFAARARAEALLGDIVHEMRINVFNTVDDPEFQCRPSLDLGPLMLRRSRLFHDHADTPVHGSTDLTRALAHRSWAVGFERLSMLMQGCDAFTIAAFNRRNMAMRMPRRLWEEGQQPEPETPYLDAALAALAEVLSAVDSLEE